MLMRLPVARFLTPFIHAERDKHNFHHPQTENQYQFFYRVTKTNVKTVKTPPVEFFAAERSILPLQPVRATEGHPWSPRSSTELPSSS